MPNHISKATLIGHMLSMSLFLNAQNFNYSHSVQSSGFVFLDSTKVVVDHSIWDDNTYEISLGFNFNFAGSAFDSVKINTNGTLSFGNNHQYNFAALFKNFIADATAERSLLSPISYQRTGSGGSVSLKIEFKNVMLIMANGNHRYLNFQIWLNETDHSVEFRMGDADSDLIAQACLLGLINMNNITDFSVGYLLQGDPASPSGAMVPALGNVVELTSLPASGTIYKFTSN
ncbi:MAG: hypothetical protein H0X46_07405 [Bacteroidetes bacterium]|nr:hypothetical protein [Bacteroidota bacterium]